MIFIELFIIFQLYNIHWITQHFGYKAGHVQSGSQVATCHLESGLEGLMGEVEEVVGEVEEVVARSHGKGAGFLDAY